MRPLSVYWAYQDVFSNYEEKVLNIRIVDIRIFYVRNKYLRMSRLLTYTFYAGDHFQ